MNKVDGSKPFFEVHIENDGTYYITEEKNKSKEHGSALSTLKNIEQVVAGNLKYSDQHQDKFSKMPEADRLKLFKEKSQEISQRYEQAASNTNWLFRALFSQEKEINAIKNRIENKIKPPKLLPLPDELIQQEIAKYLNISDTLTLREINREGVKQTASPIVENAKELGFEGISEIEAQNFLKGLFNEVKLLNEMGVLPKKCLSYVPSRHFWNPKKLDSEATLKKFMNLHPHDTLEILSNKKLYLSHFDTFRKIFNVITTEKRSVEYKNKDMLDEVAYALSHASSKGDKKILEYLINHGSNSNLALNSGLPLHHAIKGDHTDAVELLLKNKALVNIPIQGPNALRGETPLVLACGFGGAESNIEIVKLLLDSGANPNFPASNGSYPLQFAAQKGDTEIVELLLKNKADINIQGADGKTALGFAIRVEPNPDVVKLLLENGADPNILDDYGNNSLHIAALRGNADIVELLLKNKVEVDAQGYRGNTAFGLAFIQGPNPDLIKLLLENGADSNVLVNSKSIHNLTPLEIALNRNLDSIVQLLLDHESKKEI